MCDDVRRDVRVISDERSPMSDDVLWIATGPISDEGRVESGDDVLESGLRQCNWTDLTSEGRRCSLALLLCF